MGALSQLLSPDDGWREWIGSFRPDELEMEMLLKELEKATPHGRAVDLHATVTVGELVRLIGR